MLRKIRVLKKKMAKFLLVCTLCLSFTACGREEEFFLMQEEEAGSLEEGTQGSEEVSTEQQSEPKKEETVSVYVQVSGAVRYPGVYELEEGSRIFEAVELAGGLTAEADSKHLNQAEPLTDGQLIYVYAIGEQRPEESTEGEEEDDGRLNLNQATPEQLMTLPGIGQSKAEAIISYRDEHGGFEKIEDIMKIEGIKEGVFSKIKERIKVN